jgi:hypothetical protein
MLVSAMAAWMPEAVPTVIALAGTTEAAATIAEAAVSERRILRIEDPPRVCCGDFLCSYRPYNIIVWL